MLYKCNIIFGTHETYKRLCCQITNNGVLNSIKDTTPTSPFFLWCFAAAKELHKKPGQQTGGTASLQVPFYLMGGMLRVKY